MTTRNRLTRLVQAAGLSAVLVTAACAGAVDSPPPPDDVPPSAATGSASPSRTPADPSAGSALALQLPGMADAEVVSLAYGDGLAMDLYRPPGGAGPLPVVLLLHGVTSDPSPKDNGGLVGWGQALAASGLAAAVINYRPDALARDRQGIEDVAAAVRLLRDQSTDLRLDDSRLALLGFSAGGPSLVTAAFDSANEPVRAVAGLYPVLDTAKLGGETDIVAAMVSGAQERRIPVLLAYGAEDRVPGVNSAQAKLRREPATERGDIRIVQHEQGGHGFDVTSQDARSREIIQQVLTFLTEELR